VFLASFFWVARSRRQPFFWGEGFRYLDQGPISFFPPRGAKSRLKGRQKNPPKKPQCTYVLYLARIGLLYTYDDVFFFIAFLSSPYRDTPKNAIKKIGKGEKN
jgi:hypothetical protein